jgi:preprotein translocase subunit SecG
MSSTLLIVLTILAAVLVILVMLQKSSSIGLGAYSGSNDSMFGARGPANFLAKATYIIALIFVGVVLYLGYLYNQENNKSVLDDVKELTVPSVPKIKQPIKRLESIDENVSLNDDGFSKDYRINVLFDKNKFNIRNKYSGELDKLVNIMNKNKDYKLYLTAHTDNTGDDSYNINMSNKRANEAKKYIVKHGIKIDRIDAKGVGSSKPLVANDSEYNKQLNRRLEAKFANK